MQTGSEQLKNQQRLMQAEGFYNGKIDGIWGPKTIAAKVKWERSGRYSPAIPNNGFPLSDRGPFPSGVFRKADGSLTSAKLDQKSSQQPAPQPVQTQPAAPAATPVVPIAAQPAAQPEAAEAKEASTATPNFNKHNQQNQKR
jgi:hypothetical protein